MEVVLIIVAWLASGAASHIYWVTNEYDYTSDYILTSMLSALIGPIAWLVGWTVYGTPSEYKPRTIFRRRNHG